MGGQRTSCSTVAPAVSYVAVARWSRLSSVAWCSTAVNAIKASQAGPPRICPAAMVARSSWYPVCDRARNGCTPTLPAGSAQP